MPSLRVGILGTENSIWLSTFKAYKNMFNFNKPYIIFPLKCKLLHFPFADGLSIHFPFSMLPYALLVVGMNI